MRFPIYELGTVRLVRVRKALLNMPSPEES